MNVKEFGDKLRQLRILKDVQQQEVSDALGVSRPAYGKIENAKNKSLPSMEQITVIARVLGVETAELLRVANVDDTSRYTEYERVLMEDARATQYIKVALDRMKNDLRIAEEARLDLAAKPGNYDNTLNLRR